MSAGGNGPARRDELACDAALFGLDAAELAELEALEALDGDQARLELELVAGEIAALGYEARREGEPALPAALAAKIVAQSPAIAAERGPAVAAERSPAVAAERADAKVIPFPVATPPSSTVQQSLPRKRASLLPWLVAAAAIVIAIAGWLRREAPPVTVIPPGPSAPIASAPKPEVVRPDTPAAAREALLAITGTTQTAWKATTDASAKGAGGDVIWHSGVQRGFMRFTGLAANDPATSQYQLWIFDAERDERYPVDGGVFDVGPSGEIVVPIAAKLHVNSPKLFAVTVEKPGGVVVSKRERIVLTASLPPT